MPHISKALLLVNRFAYDNDVFFEFHFDYFCVKDQQSKKTFLSGSSNNALYEFQARPTSPPSIFLAEYASLTIWHQWLD